MAIDILPKELSTGAEVGNAFGQGLQTGLQGLLNNMAQQRATQMQAKQRAPALQQLLGLSSPEQALQYAYQPESILKELVKHHLGAPERQAYGQMLNQLLGNQEDNQQPETEGQPLTNNKPSTPSISPEINPRQALDLAKLVEERKKTNIAQQGVTLGRWDKYVDKIEKKAAPARQLINAANQALELLKTQKPITGVWGKVTPEYLQTPEGQALISKLKQIVSLKGKVGGGRLLAKGLELEEASKAQIWQNPKVIEKILTDIRDDPEVLKDISEGDAIEQVNSQYGDKIPKDFLKVTREKSNALLKESKIQKNTFMELPPASQFEGKIARNPATNQRMKSINGKWEPIKE